MKATAAFGKTAIEAYQNLGKNPNDWSCQTIKTGEMESNFAVKRLRPKAATPSALHDATPQLSLITVSLYQSAGSKRVMACRTILLLFRRSFATILVVRSFNEGSCQ
jgi:hypothetical protein